MQVIGAAIGGVVLLQLLLALGASLARLRAQHAIRQRSMRLLEERISATSALRQQREEARLGWNGFRKFVVDKKVVEAEGVLSLYLIPHDQKPLPLFAPGQFLTFRCSVSGHDKPLIRCYSLSCPPNKLYYRVTIKRVPPPADHPDAPPGVVSNHFHDRVREGDILDVQAPRGNFNIDPSLQTPLVLIAGGVGVTPMLSMIGAIAASRSKRLTYLFLGVRNRLEHPEKDYLETIAQNHANIRIHTCYSQPTADCRLGRDYNFAGRISLDVLRRVLPSSNFDFYLCGPSEMMKSLLAELHAWGVPSDRVFTEAFGPASGKVLAAVPPPEPPTVETGAPSGWEIRFARSGRQLAWDNRCGNLLEFSRKNGIILDSGCETGNCGSCLVAIREGRIKHVGDVNADCEDGACLTCIAVPEGPLELDA
jgi:uncharacterized protein